MTNEWDSARRLTGWESYKDTELVDWVALQNSVGYIIRQHLWFTRGKIPW